MITQAKVPSRENGTLISFFPHPGWSRIFPIPWAVLPDHALSKGQIHCRPPFELPSFLHLQIPQHPCSQVRWLSILLSDPHLQSSSKGVGKEGTEDANTAAQNRRCYREWDGGDQQDRRSSEYQPPLFSSQRRHLAYSLRTWPHPRTHCVWEWAVCGQNLYRSLPCRVLDIPHSPWLGSSLLWEKSHFQVCMCSKIGTPGKGRSLVQQR